MATATTTTRRALLKAAPAVLVAAAVPAAAAAETPIMALFREYERMTVALDALPAETSDEDCDRLYAPRDAIEGRIMALPCVTAADFAVKAMIATDDGGMRLDWDTDPLWIEARALIKAA